MGSIEGESLDLEVKHKDNGSWHPCTVSLSSIDSKSSIIINFKNSNEEDIISTKEDALARLRFPSTPLQDGECSSIKEGDCVLAMCKDQFRSMFFDAVIVKPYRVKHSSRVFCRCNFEIKWLIPEMEEETVTIPSKSIMKLSGEQTESHPIFAAFLKFLSTIDLGKIPASPSLEETNSEADLQGILEKQIEEISKLADGSVEFSAELLDVTRGKFAGPKLSKAVVTSRVSSNNNQHMLRRSTRSQNKEQIEIKEELEEDKSFLSPLAARAAFASMLHGNELPLKRELSFSCIEKEGSENKVQKDSATHVKVHSYDVRCEYREDTHVESISRHSNSKGANNIKPRKWSYPDEPSQSTEESGDKGCTLTTKRKSIDSTEVGKLGIQSMATRVTRSSVNKDLEAFPAEVKEGSREQPAVPVNMRRKTRSSLHDETEISMGEAKRLSSIEKITTPVTTARLTRSRNQKELGNSGVDQESGNTHELSQDSENKRGSGPPIINEPSDSIKVQKLCSQPTTKRATRSSGHKEIEFSLNEVEQGSSIEKITSPVDTSRLTRSRNQEQQSNSDADQEPWKNDPIKNNRELSEISGDKRGSSPAVLSDSIDSSKLKKLSGQFITKRVTRSSLQKEIEAPLDKIKQETSSSGSKKKREISSFMGSTMELSHESNKRTRTSLGTVVTTEDSGSVTEDRDNTSGEKMQNERKNAMPSKNPQLRSSPRPNYVPKTRAQKRASGNC